MDRPITLFCSLQINPHLFNLTAAVCRQAQKWDSVLFENAILQPITLGLFGAGRSLDHAELVIEGILHRLKLAGIAAKGEDQTLFRVCLSLIHLWVEITGQGRSVGNEICFLSFCSVLSKESDAFVRP